ncbi:MAG: GNAT family N-acetyltransferase [Thermoplasmata archaeon]
MDQAYSIRPAVDADFEAEARIHREFDAAHAPTVPELRHWDEILRLDPSHANLRFAVEQRATGLVVAYGSLAQPSFNFDPDRYWIWVAVAPGHRRRGIGAGLYAQIEAEARSRHALGLWAATCESYPDGVRFLDRRGFTVRRKIWESRIDLMELDLSNVRDGSSSPRLEGLRLTTLAEEGADSPEIRRSVYDLTRASGADIPRLGNFHPFSFEEFVAIDIESPGAVPEGFFLACKGKQVVGMSSLEKDLARLDTVKVGYTGTLPEFRGRGIATELKRRATMYAASRGYRYLVTGNDSSNERIITINRRFGFRPDVVWLQGEKVLQHQK